MAFSLNADFQDTFRNAIFGPLMSAQMPGTAVGPAQAPQVGGPGVPSFGFPGNVAFGADGLPAGIANNVEHPSNTFVTQTYYARANKDGAELKFVEGQFMFVHRDVSPLRIDREVYNLHTIYNLPYLNAILAEAWIKFTNAANSGDPEATRLRQLLSEYSEQEIMASERARRDYYATSVEQNLARQRLPNQADIPPFPQPQKIHILPQAYPPATPTGKTGTSADLETLAEFGRKNIYRYVIAPIYIMDQWNFGGVLHTPAGDPAREAVQRLASSDRAVTMALNVARRARVHNIFGDVKDSSSLYFVLRRQRLTDGTYGAFQYIPYASVTDGYVPDHELYYRDRSGKRQKGLGIYLGKVQLLEKAGNDFTKTAIDIAVGKKVSRNPDEHKRATINLGLLQIGLHE